RRRDRARETRCGPASRRGFRAHLPRFARRLRRRGRGDAPGSQAARRFGHAGLPVPHRPPIGRAGTRARDPRTRGDRAGRGPLATSARRGQRRHRRAGTRCSYRSRYGGGGGAHRRAIGLPQGIREAPHGPSRRHRDVGSVNAMPSFDIVSKVNEQEVDNAFQQARKEIEQRYDFKGTETELTKAEKEKGIRLRSSTEQRLEAAREVLVQKLAKRNVSLRGVKYGAVEQSGKHVRQLLPVAQGLETE